MLLVVLYMCNHQFVPLSVGPLFPLPYLSRSLNVCFLSIRQSRIRCQSSDKREKTRDKDKRRRQIFVSISFRTEDMNGGWLLSPSAAAVNEESEEEEMETPYELFSNRTSRNEEHLWTMTSLSMCLKESEAKMNDLWSSLSSILSSIILLSSFWLWSHDCFLQSTIVLSS